MDGYTIYESYLKTPCFVQLCLQVNKMRISLRVLPIYVNVYLVLTNSCVVTKLISNDIII